MRYVRQIAFAAGVVMFVQLAPAARAEASTFDGSWNVQIASSGVACPSGATVSIDINNGQVESNNAAVTASGHVADAGTINVTLSNGLNRAVGYGRLTGTTGSGTWRGAMCSGTWTAQRN